jgi:hypothetical protein
MKVFDKKIVTLNNGEAKVKVLVYMKKVSVRNNNHIVRAFCKVIGDN